MTFYDVLEDIKKLIGLDLQSIRPGANIIITDVDEERSCIILRTSAGVSRSRPLSELQYLWNEMNRLPAVHVDEALHGSGTSRNQPETILANLPYVEWLKIDNKKHIAFVGKSTHPYGTLKQMDSISASNVKAINPPTTRLSKVKVVIVTNDLASTISFLQNKLSGLVSTIKQGIYTFESGNLEATILSTSIVTLSVGTYTVLPQSPTSSAKVVTIQGVEYYVFDEVNTKLLVQK